MWYSCPKVYKYILELGCCIEKQEIKYREKKSNQMENELCPKQII